ncbi:DUF823 domain-containing adhesin [Vibrio sp. S234-5]|uniref:adhesion domain-containing protein n=1 Tax=Vibrio sp. S234-5 TaxID=1616781 RepID=UPI0009E38F69|nr:DUF823 domain-containing adhesin [Vibrio sp. S234-5]
MKRTQFKMKKKHAMKVAPLMMSLLLMACGGEDSGLPNQGIGNGNGGGGNPPMFNGFCAVGEEGTEDCDGFCTLPEEEGSEDCGYGSNGGNGNGNGNGVCEAGEDHTPDCDGLYVSPAEKGSIDENGAQLSSITVSPDPLTLYKPLGGELTATGTFDNGQSKNITGLLDWTSGDEAIATVEGPSEGYDGNIESVAVASQGVGSTTMTAQSDTVSGEVAVSVAQGTVNANSVALMLEHESVNLNLSNQATVEFELEEQPGVIISSADMADAGNITWQLDPQENGLSVDAEGKVSTEMTTETLGLTQSDPHITVVANFDAGGLFAGVTGMQKDFTLTASAVDGGATQVVTTVDGTTSHESALDVPKGSEVKVEAEFHFEDGSSYTTTDSEYVTWTVSPEDSGVTVDENGMVDTSGVTGSEEVVVTITATGHGPFEGVTKTTILTVTPPPYPEGSIEVPGIGVFTKPLTTTQADSLGVSYSTSYTELGETWPHYTQPQAEAMCSQLAYRLATKDELLALYAEHPNHTLKTVSGWPTNINYWTSTANGPNYYNIHLGGGSTGSSASNNLRNASCVSGS